MKNVLNIHKQYESLGQNSVMDQMHKKFLELPDSDPKGGNDAEPKAG